MEDIESAWMNFCIDDLKRVEYTTEPAGDMATIIDCAPTKCAPKCSPLNISTKTKISYLNQPIDLKTVFWNIPLIPYHKPTVGVVKKQMKFNSNTMEEVNEIELKKTAYEYIDDYIISQIHKPEGRIKFKDIRKVSIGICKKDITSYRCKRKSAFYNCFVVILRLFHNEVYKEIHVKVFNTGKLEIPGIQDSTILNKALALLVDIVKPLVQTDTPIMFLDHKTETVMINSNFSCNYFINRDKMYKLLKYKYKINSNFDPCSYPGIQCEFYHDEILLFQSGIQPSSERNNNTNPITKVSFMIFRTGSVLIVGKCSEEILYQIYNYLCHIFEHDYDEIKGMNTTENACATATNTASANTASANTTDIKSKEKTRKMRKKLITTT
jgi:hypothetical protein